MLFGIFCYHKCSHFNRVLTNEVGQRHRNRWRRYIVPILVSIDCGHMQDLEYIIPAHCLHSSLGYKMYRSHTCRTERAECGGFVYHDAAPSLVFFCVCGHGQQFVTQYWHAINTQPDCYSIQLIWETSIPTHTHKYIGCPLYLSFRYLFFQSSSSCPFSISRLLLSSFHNMQYWFVFFLLTCNRIYPHFRINLFIPICFQFICLFDGVFIYTFRK